jgi:hypothetical protein
MKYAGAVLIGLTLLSFIYPGYQVFVGDQRLFLPWVKHDLRPDLYQNDPVASIDHLRWSLFDEVVAGTVNIFHIDLFVVLLMIGVATRFLYFYCIWRLALYVTNNAVFSLMAPALFMTNKVVFGSAMTTMIYETHYRTVSIALALLFLVLYLNKKRMWSLVALVASGMMNPLTVPPFLVFLILDTAWRWWEKRRHV